MTPHSFQEMVAHPNLPAMGFAEEVFLISGGLVQLCGRVARIAGPGEIVVQAALVAALWVFLVPIQVMLAFVAVLVRLVSRRGEFGYNLMLLAIVAAPVALVAYFFGADTLVDILRAYHLKS